MKIRPFQIEDEDSVIALWQKCSLFYVGSEGLARYHIHEKITSQPDLFIVGVFDQQIIATAMADFNAHNLQGMLRYVAVAPKYRLQGYASSIMSTLEGLLIMRGCKNLCLQVGPNRYPALQCYCRQGYVIKELIMSKNLSSSVKDEQGETSI